MIDNPSSYFFLLAEWCEMGEQESEHVHTVHNSEGDSSHKAWQTMWREDGDGVAFSYLLKARCFLNIKESITICLRPEYPNKKSIRPALSLTVKLSTEKALCIWHVLSVYSFEKIYGTDIIKSLFSLWWELQNSLTIMEALLEESTLFLIPELLKLVNGPRCLTA